MLLQFLDEFGIESLGAAISRGNIPAGLRRRGPSNAAANPAEACGRPLIGALELRDRALDRTAWHELNDREGNQHDAEDGRDHQENAAENVG